MIMIVPTKRQAAPGFRRLVLAALGVSLILTTGCAFPRKDYSGVPDVNAIRVVQGPDGRLAAQAPDCATLLQGSRYHSLNDARPAIAFGCATYTNLAASLARPADLVSPREFAGHQADAAALAVQRYRLNQVEPLRETQSTNVGGN